MAISTRTEGALIAVETMRRLRGEYPQVKFSLGLSNISFGLPARSLINQAFLAQALAAGLDAAIIDPLDAGLINMIYATELVKKMDQHGAKAYLVNTGWNGTGKRISIKDTRAIIDAIIDGSIERAETKHIPILNLTAPVRLNNVSEGILDPRDTYADKGEWEGKARDLSARYNKNFQQYTDTEAGKALISAGPQI